MKPLHRCLKASLTTILPIVLTSIELAGGQHRKPPGSNTRETLTLSRTHSIFSPRLNVIFNVRFKYTPLWCSDSRVERFANVHEASSFFLLFFLFDEESWLIRTYHDSRLGRRTAINAGSTHTEPFYARSLA